MLLGYYNEELYGLMDLLSFLECKIRALSSRVRIKGVPVQTES